MLTKQFLVKPEHIDFQGILDGLYYPFYYEWTRHAYAHEVLGISLEEEAKKGILYVLFEYTLLLKKPIKDGDILDVTCELAPLEKPTRFKFVQKILSNNIVCSEATFFSTCIKNGRPYIPDEIKKIFENQVR